ncbi:MAG TPA: transglycosylase domain-containing protein [Bacteroidales bacterium]|nr:transglycosylase domain-containing protein [Bacteroidales bacterium]HPT04926.1 transglycosylase domain-containing protein [Bacteroidales bacterium]
MKISIEKILDALLKVHHFIKKLRIRQRIKHFFLIPKGTPLYKRILLRIVHVIIIIFIGLGMVDSNILWLFGRSPSIRSINDPDQKITSELYSADGKLIGKYFDENRSPLKYEEIPENIIKSLIATEDTRFYQHHGVDFKATMSIFWYMLHGEKRGGSTITQQLVKNLFKTRGQYSRGLLGRIPGIRTVVAKTKEWIAAIKIELFYSKSEILTMYFNTNDFGSNAYGLKTAAKTFFNKKASQLKWEESAVLVGLLKAPTYYSPISHAARSRERRNIVLNQLVKYGMLEQSQCDSLSNLPLKLHYSVENNYDGEASYFREAVYNYLKPWLKENNLDLYADGLKIYSTLDSRMQAYAEEATSEHMKALQKRFNQHWQGQNPWVDANNKELPDYINNVAKRTEMYDFLEKKYKKYPDSVDYYMNLPHRMTVFTWDGEKDTTLSSMDSIKYYNHFLHAGFIAMEQNTGFVKSWVGDIDYKYFKFDNVKQSKRQPGSTFKAFVYSAAMENGMGPCDMMTDIPVSYEYVEKGQNKVWTPHNADGSFSGRSVTLKYAFAKSINSIAVQVTKKLGWKKVIEYAHKMGIKTELEDVPSVCLGSSDVSLYELVDAYCPTVNDGYALDPVLVTKIVDKDGKVIYEYKPEKKRVLSEESAFLMNQMMQGGLHEPGGTTQALFEYDLFRYDTDFGGKTGTSSNHSDGWFVGVTPTLIAGAWVGGESRSVHFRTAELGEGCHTALPIYGLFMEKVLADKRFAYLKGHFPKPTVKINKSYTCHTFIPKADTLPADSLGDAIPEDF